MCKGNGRGDVPKIGSTWLYLPGVKFSVASAGMWGSRDGGDEAGEMRQGWVD
jgi:hypothetical protein